MVVWCDIYNTQVIDLFLQILNGFKSEVDAESWKKFFEQFPPPLQKRLNEVYGL